MHNDQLSRTLLKIDQQTANVLITFQKYCNSMRYINYSSRRTASRLKTILIEKHFWKYKRKYVMIVTTSPSTIRVTIGVTDNGLKSP